MTEQITQVAQSNFLSLMATPGGMIGLLIGGIALIYIFGKEFKFFYTLIIAVLFGSFNFWLSTTLNIPLGTLLIGQGLGYIGAKLGIYDAMGSAISGSGINTERPNFTLPSFGKKTNEGA